MNLVKLLFAAVMAVVLSGCIQSKTNFEPMRQATYQLTNDFGSCSAVVIAPEKVLTAAHCDGPNLKFNGVKAIVVKKNEVADLMLLSVPFLACPCASIGSMPDLDTPVVTAGFPLGLGEALTEGKMQGFLIVEPDFPQEVKDMLAHRMLITSPAIFGNSGGPVFVFERGQWRVVGIMSQVAVAAVGGFIPNMIPHLAIAVNTDTIKEFLK